MVQTLLIGAFNTIKHCLKKFTIVVLLVQIAHKCLGVFLVGAGDIDI